MNRQSNFPDTARGGSTLRVASQGEAEQADSRQGQPPEAYPPQQTVWELIARQARAHPRRTAVVDGAAEIDYRRLTERAAVVAAELAARGVEPGSLVGVCMSRTWELVATLLGVLQGGCAYVPLDPKYPRKRVHYMLEHARIAAAIVDHEDLAELCEGAPELIRLDELQAEKAEEVGLDAGSRPSPEDLAYVLYTSGSTGRPKGVAIEHRSVVELSRAMDTIFEEEELQGVLAAASICFDASVAEILGTLSLGGTLVLAQNVLELPELPAADRVRMCIMVPSSMKALLAVGELPKSLRCIALGGEALQRSLVERLHALQPQPRVINVYGPTEDTVFSIVREIPVGMETITIGTPVAGCRSYVLDESLQPVPVGVPGELYLAGNQLARGYLHDAERTRERFLEVEPNDAVPEHRLYKTGDLCQRREDGDFEFLGRLDQQTKIRGFRIELEEIEAILETMEGVAGAAAAVVDGGGGHQMLVGYVVASPPEPPAQAVSSESARTYLAERLPGYMVPQMVMHLEELPRLPNGKLDRKALPEPDLARLPAAAPHSAGGGNGTSPAGAAGSLAHRLAGLSRSDQHGLLLSVVQGEIASLLRLGDPEKVSPQHLLDDLGIDSLTKVELSSRLGAVIDRKLPVSAIMEHSTPDALASYFLETMAAGTESSPATGAPSAQNRRGAWDTLASLQAQMQSCYPPFSAAKTKAWSATDKGALVRELKHLVSRPGDPFSKLVRTGSGQRGIVADVDTDREREAIIWTTNLYLGLNRDPEVIEKARIALERFGTGMGTSAAASGITDLHLEFEQGFAELVGKGDACLFPTGYTANVGAIAGVLGEGDVVVMDQLCHASIVDGARLCGATMRSFQHNNPADLEAVLQTEASPYRTVLVVLEGVYSMGEGAARVEEIVRTAKKYDALVLVDEAHSFGFYGSRGAGICAARGVTEQVDFIMTTLSKALGSLGGVVAASKEHIALLKSNSRAFIFQASTSPADIAAALAALRRLSEDDALRARLWDTTGYMRQRFSDAGYDLGSGDGPIVTPHFPDKEKLFAIVNGMFERGVHTSAVTYPIVEVGKGRLRFICSAAHTREDVDKTVEALIEAEREAEAKLATARDESGGAHAGRDEVEAWAHAFSAFLQESLAGAAVPTPDLAVAVRPPDAEEPIQILIREGTAQVVGPEAGGPATSELPTCSLLLHDHRAAAALCSSDLQGLLESILQSSCVLNGQVEPFIWLFGRLDDWQRNSSAGLH